MMALQKSLLEQTDIVPVLESFNFEASTNGDLTVSNPPPFKIDDRVLDNIKSAQHENKENMPTGSD